jgi:diguanylate cyclase (GGDEF)-like protein/PAS domain S-box-containing protein
MTRKRTLPSSLGTWPAWSVFLVALFVALATGGSIFHLVTRSTEASRAQLLMARIEEKAAALALFEPVVTSAEAFSPTVAQELRKQMGYLEFLISQSLAETNHLDAKFQELGRVREAVISFRALSARELELSEKGNQERARATHDRLVASLESLEDALATTSSAYESLARRADQVAVFGSFLIMVIGAVTIGVLFWRYERARRAAASQRARAEARFSSLVQNSADGIMLTDAGGFIVYASAATERLLGHPPSAVVGTRALDLVHPEDRGRIVEAGAEFQLNPGSHQKYEVRALHADGSLRWVEFEATNLLHDPNVAGIVTNFRDISARKNLEDDLRHRAFHDPLTGLANRTLFADRVKLAEARADRKGGRYAVFILDVDDFKNVNDTLGHDVGDQLLAALAERLSGQLRAPDTLARLGGDEFAILIEDVENEAALSLVTNRLMSVFSLPFQLSCGEVVVGGSLGTAASSPLEHRSKELLRNADVAMYMAKAGGKGSSEIFEAGMHAPMVERLQLRADLQTAVTEGQLRLDYQPIVDLEEGTILALEALVRWEHPRRGLLSPDEFIPLAEETGDIVPVGNWVLDEACRQGRAWQLRHTTHSSVGISVNLSPRQLRDPGFSDRVAHALTQSGLAPATLILEITESTLMTDTGSAVQRLEELKELGVRLAIDDFGTGYSSLSYLRRFPIDILKMDKTFIEGVVAGAEDAAIAHALVALGDTLQLETLAEGIENAEQLAAVRRAGYSLGQGYFLARPLEATSIDDLLELPALIAAAPVSALNPSLDHSPRSGIPSDEVDASA